MFALLITNMGWCAYVCSKCLLVILESFVENKIYVCAATRQDNKETGALSEEEENTGKPWRGESLVHAQ